MVADALGLVEGRDYERICMGEGGFNAVIEDLSEHQSASNKTFRPAQFCDISAQTITVTDHRTEDLGIQVRNAGGGMSEDEVELKCEL